MTGEPTVDPRYLPPPMNPGPVERPVDLRAVVASEWARDRLATIAAGSPRSRQTAIGPSELGSHCPRRLAYRLAGTPVVNLPDPLLAMLGTGMHHVIAQGLAEQDPARSRFLIEHRVDYRGVAGSVDLFDRLTHRMTDWKTTTVSRIRRYATDGPPAQHVVQVQVYGQGLIAQGEQVDVLALTYIPRDGTLRDVWTWATTPIPAIADQAVDRHDRILTQVRQSGPASVDAVPTLCTYCPNHRPGAVNLAVACPGKELA